MNQLEIAKSYAKQGIPIFPCSIEKRPLTKNGHTNASKDIKQVEAWWTKHPNALIGSPNEKFTVLDIDCHGLCPTGQLLTDNAIKLLKDEKIITDEVFRVRTISGGYHYYYKHEDISRSIKALPNIDILGNGGYCILPDQKNYVCESYDEPWAQIKKLKKLNTVKLSILADENEDYTKAATLLKKAAKGMISHTKKSTKTNANPTISKEEKEQIKNGGFKVYNDYENSTVKFIYGEGIYEKGERHYEFDPKNKLLNEEGKIKLYKGQTTQEMILGMFFNIDIQKKLGEYVGLNVPQLNHSSKQRSVLPNHNDRRPSMSVRWVEGNHLVARDHSNHFSDKYNQIDYDVIRLYTTEVYKSATPRFSSGERNMWFLKLMYDAGLLDTTELDFTFHSDKYMDHLNPSEQKVLDGYKILFMLKSTYAEFDGHTAFSDRFASGWCGVSVSSANRAKQTLIEQGFIAFVDNINCDKETEDFNLNVTRGLKPITTEDNFDDLIEQSFNNEEVYQAKRKEILEKLKENENVNSVDVSKNDNVKSVANSADVLATKLDTIKGFGKEFAKRFQSKSVNSVDVSKSDNVNSVENLLEKVKIKDIFVNSVVKSNTIVVNSYVNSEKKETDDEKWYGYHKRPIDKYYHQTEPIFIGERDP